MTHSILFFAACRIVFRAMVHHRNVGGRRGPS